MKASPASNRVNPITKITGHPFSLNYTVIYATARETVVFVPTLTTAVTGSLITFSSATSIFDWKPLTSSI